MPQPRDPESHRQRWKALADAARARTAEHGVTADVARSGAILAGHEIEIADGKPHTVGARKAGSRQRGISLVEVTIAVAMLGLVVLIAAPAFGTMMRQSRVQASARQFAGDIRNARARAASTGWEYKIVGFRAGTGTNANQYRLFGRKSGAVTWPVDTAAAASTSTTYAGGWIDFTKLYPGVSMSPGGSTGVSRFELSFEPRGVVKLSSGSFDPFTLNGTGGATKSLRVSTLGNVTIQ